MSRSLKKGPFVDKKLLKKIIDASKSKKKKIIKTWSRSCSITPEMVDKTIAVHNGKEFTNVFISEQMVGHKLGEFSLTRKFSGHSKKGKIAKSTGFAGRVDK